VFLGSRSSAGYQPAGRQGAPNQEEKIEMWFVYVIRSIETGRFYTGMTENLERRLKEHNQGKTKSTKAYAPWELVYKESVDSRLAARQREKWLKSGVGREFIKKMVA
jgi:putative endonuclease